MPLLKYRCRECDIVFDTLVTVSRMEDVQCERCGGPVERAYEGACLFGSVSASAERGCPADCGAGCAGQHHGGGCQCAGCR